MYNEGRGKKSKGERVLQVIHTQTNHVAMEWYNQEVNQTTSPSPLPKTLHQLCLRCIHDHFTDIHSLSHLPSNILQQVQHFMMKARMMGSRLLNDLNVHKLLVPNLEELDLSGFWVSDQPFLEHYNCPYLVILNLYVFSLLLVLT
jgi:hypothetical protein